MKQRATLIIALFVSISINPMYGSGVTTRGDYQKIITLSTAGKTGDFDLAVNIINEKPHLSLVPLDNENNTFIHYVAYRGNLYLMKEIIANLQFTNNSLCNKRGLTPLDMAQSGLEELDDPTFTDPTYIVFEEEKQIYNQLCPITEVKRKYREIIQLLTQS